MGRMTLILAGGGSPATLRPFIDRFLHHAREQGNDRPRIAVVTANTDSRLQLADFLPLIDGRCVPVQLVAKLSADGTDRVVAPFDGGELLNADGIIVLDGSVTGLLNALEHRAGDVRRLVHDGIPYLGIGAGAAIASELALRGGNMIGGVRVGPATTDSPDGELIAGEGLGLVDLSIMSHAAELGRVGIAIAAIEAEMTDRILAIDADTALEVSESGLEVLGTGTVWQLTGTDQGVLVASSRA